MAQTPSDIDAPPALRPSKEEMKQLVDFHYALIQWVARARYNDYKDEHWRAQNTQLVQQYYRLWPLLDRYGCEAETIVANLLNNRAFAYDAWDKVARGDLFFNQAEKIDPQSEQEEDEEKDYPPLSPVKFSKLLDHFYVLSDSYRRESFPNLRKQDVEQEIREEIRSKAERGVPFIDHYTANKDKVQDVLEKAIAPTSFMSDQLFDQEAAKALRVFCALTAYRQAGLSGETSIWEHWMSKYEHVSPIDFAMPEMEAFAQISAAFQKHVDPRNPQQQQEIEMVLRALSAAARNEFQSDVPDMGKSWMQNIRAALTQNLRSHKNPSLG